MSDLLKDLKFAARTLLRTPAFTVAAVLTLALGIGLNTATFSAVYTLLMRPLPGVQQPDRLVQLFQRFSGDFLFGSNSIPHYQSVRDGSGDVYESVAAWAFEPLSFSAEGRSERLLGLMVSANFFQTMGAEPALGRAFLPGVEDTGPGEHPVAVLSNGFWTERFGADPDVVGRTIRLNGRPFEVVGVAPAGFNGPVSVVAPPVFVPLMMQREVMPGSDRLEVRGSSFMQVVARLRDGVTVEQARQRMDALYQALREEYPDSYGEKGGIQLVPQAEAGLNPTWGSTQQGFGAAMMAVVTLLLLIACVNVANLFLVRARERRTEMGIRLSLGASRGRVIRQLLTESLLFGLLAGVAGLVLGFVAIQLLGSIRPPFEGPWDLRLALDGTVLLFTFGVSVAAGLLFGMVPAIQASRPDTVTALKSDAGGSGRSRTTSALVVAQMALSLVLLVSAGLFVRSLRSATSIDPGFRSEGLLIASVDPGLQGYGIQEARDFYDRLMERLRSLPGVAAAGLGEQPPLGMGSQQNGVQVPGYEFAPNERRSIDYNIVGTGYFEAMGIRLVEGRSFLRDDDTDGEPVIVVNRRFAERFWPGESALGKTVHTSGQDRRVIGVTANGKYNTLGEDPLSFMYLPHGQFFNYAMTIAVRTADPTAAAGIAPAVREEIRTLDPDLPVYDVRTMETHLGLALMPARLGGFGLGLFGMLGLILAAVGIYGVMAYSVSRRKREMGIRMALGAAPGSVVTMLLREGLVLTLIGAGLGLAAAVGASRLLAGLLYGVSALDPVAFTTVPALLVGVAAMAVWLPARRAAAVDPARSLRAE